jgi:predicted nucleic-acid-binding Zn-ribbon protein
MAIDDDLGRRFVCGKCKARGAEVKRMTATRTGLSGMFGLQHLFIAVTCMACGYTELYDPQVLEGKDDAGAILDAILGG